MIWLFLSVAFAGEPMQKGEVLKQDSYVFSIDEAKDLMAKMEQLEKEEKLLEEFKNLDDIHEKKETLLLSTIDLKELEAEQYKALYEQSLKQETKLEKRDTISTIESAGLFTGGIVVTVASILIADKVDDFIQGN